MKNNLASFPSMNYLLQNKYNENLCDDFRGGIITHFENMMQILKHDANI